MCETRQIMAVRTAVWGDADEVRDHLDSLQDVGQRGTPGSDALAASMAAFGLIAVPS